MGSRGRPTGFQGVAGKPIGSQGVQLVQVVQAVHVVQVVQVVKVVSRGVAYRVPGDRGVGLQGPRGSRGRPTGSQRVKG